MKLRLLPSNCVIIAALVFLLVSLVNPACGWTPFGKDVDRMAVEVPKNLSSPHPRFMEMALKQARKAQDKGEVPIGAIIVRRLPDGKLEVLSEACNLVETTHDASAHAEMLALKKAASKIKNWRLTNATLYSTLEPCPMCLAAAQAFRVSSIVYGAPDLRLGAIKTHVRLLDIEHPYHKIDEVIPDVCAHESAAMLRSFFRARRKQASKTDERQPRRLSKLISYFRKLKSGDRT